MSQKIVIVGTGGTIAGLSLVPGTGGAYKAAQVDVQTLVAQAARSESGLSRVGSGVNAAPHVQTEQLVQVDSKDMTESIWQRLLKRVAELQQDPEVHSVVITHGTDTLEETGFLLHACWPQGKPVVLTCAMRPADAPDADGPANLRDAIRVASTPGLSGVLMVCDGQVFEGHVFQKVRTEGVQPFEAEPIGVVGECRDGHYVAQQARDTARAYPVVTQAEWPRLLAAQDWPRVEIVMNHAGADGRVVRDMLMATSTTPSADRLRGIVVAGTGSGTCSERLMVALQQAHDQGVVVWRSTRATWGMARSLATDVFTGVPWSPAKARVALMLDLLLARR